MWDSIGLFIFLVAVFVAGAFFFFRLGFLHGYLRGVNELAKARLPTREYNARLDQPGNDDVSVEYSGPSEKTLKRLQQLREPVTVQYQYNLAPDDELLPKEGSNVGE